MSDHDATGAHHFDVIVVGAGFSGLYALHRLRALGFSVRVLERGGGVGGTWFWNRYPGARCDIESVDYCYSFSPELLDEWQWSERYAAQPEILRYLNHVADRFDLRRDIQLSTEVTSAYYQEAESRWTITTAADERLSARWCIMCVGCLSKVKRPDFPGLDRFEGLWFHTAQWPEEEVDFTGRRVAVIGTGSTAIQAVPRIARQAERLTVFQRTPNYSMPAQNRPLDPGLLQEIRRGYAERRRFAEQSDAGVPFPAPTKSTFEVSDEERRRMYEAGWQRGGINALSYAFTDFFTNPEANSMAAEFTRQKIRDIVRDPQRAETLSPRQHIGTKRTCVDIGYYETYNRDNVELVDVRRTPITEITADGLRTTEAEYEVDSIVFAIGFDAITGPYLGMDIRGVGGRSLAQHWAEGPRTYLGLSSAGFPNLFMVTGPGSPSVLSNMVVSIEQHVDWISECVTELRRRGVERIEATAEAEQGWVDYVNELANETLYPVANSWYVGANIPGKPRVFMPYVGGCGRYRRECDDVAAQGYAGFTLGRPTDHASEPQAAHA
jgi:cation diffusion facilitator CzcD-associated flavoprotein CzcO